MSSSLNIVRRSPAHLQLDLPEVPERLQLVYASRGITAKEQLNHGTRSLLHYQSLQGIAAAVRRLCQALESNQKIVIVGDFDADGATSTALSLLALRQLGFSRLDYLVPNRFDFGYGLSPEIVEVAAQRGADLIITVDNGIACLDGASRARSLGMGLIITDHHLPADRLPEADAIVNPNQPGCEFMSKNLAGVGVAFYLMLALCRHMQEQGYFGEARGPSPADFLDLVALGTVADVVSLDQNNRVLVHQGLQRIRSGHCRPGIQAMVEVAGRNLADLQASDLGFVLGPRINAAGRLDDMVMGIECLLTDDLARARQMAVQLDSLNQERKDIEAGMKQEAVKILESLQFSDQSLPDGIALYQSDWHQGVIGIVAGRIKDQYFRPTVAFAHQDDDTLKGSARSIPGLHIRDLLEEISHRYPEVITKFGGHAMAAGLTLPVVQFDAFKTVFAQVASEWLAGRSLTGEILSDGELSDEQLSLDFAEQIKQAGPWGQGFPEPVFDGVFEVVEQRLVGEKHLKLQLSSPTGRLIDGIAFNVDTAIWPDRRIRQVQIAYKLDINRFRGRVSPQLLVDAIAPV